MQQNPPVGSTKPPGGSASWVMEQKEIVSVLGCVSLIEVECLSQMESPWRLGKGRDLPIPCSRDNICCKDRGHALDLCLAQPLPQGFCSGHKLQHSRVANSMARSSCQQHGSPSRLPAKILPEELSIISSYRMYCTCYEEGDGKPGAGGTEADASMHTPASGIGIHTPTKACTFNCTGLFPPLKWENPSQCHTDSVFMKLSIVN